MRLLCSVDAATSPEHWLATSMSASLRASASMAVPFQLRLPASGNVALCFSDISCAGDVNLVVTADATVQASGSPRAGVQNGAQAS
jgi:hypothetical protein